MAEVLLTDEDMAAFSQGQPRDLLAGDDAPEVTEQASNDLGGISGGWNAVNAIDDSITLKAGGLIADKAIETFSDEDQEGTWGALRKHHNQSELYKKWQPKIWDAEDQLNSISDKNTPQYQEAWANLQDVKANYESDKKGEYVEQTTPFDFGEFVSVLSENPGYVLGSIAKSVAIDPGLLVVPGGWMKAGALAVKVTKNASKTAQITAKVAAQMAGAAAVATPIGAGAEIVTQLDTNPNAPIDYNRVANTAIFTAGTAAALPPLGMAAKGVGKGIANASKKPIQKLGEIYDARTIQKIQNDAQKIFIGGLSDDKPPMFTKEAAVQKAIAGKAPSDKVIDTLPTMDEYMSDAALAARREVMDAAGPVTKAVEATGEGYKKLVTGWNDLTEPVVTTLRKMALPHLARALDEHDMNVGTDIDRKLSIQQQYSKAYKNLNKNQKAEAHWLQRNGELGLEANRARFPQEFMESFDEVRKMLDAEYDEAIDAGMKIGRTDNYFPADFDYPRYMKDNGVEFGQMAKDFADAANKKLNLQRKERLSPADMTEDMVRRHLTPEDIATVVIRKSAGEAPEQGLSTSTLENRSRSIDFATPEMMKYYKDPTAALHNHIARMTPKIHDRKFFGGQKIAEDLDGMPVKAGDDTIYDAYIKDHVARLIADKQMAPADYDRVVKVLRARFVGARRQASPLINGTKNIFYAATLGNPLAASVQAGDIGAAQYLNVTRGIDSVIGDAIKGTRFRMKDFGLESIPELESMGATRKVLNWSLRAGGFQAMDRLGKETILNSTYKKLRDVTKKLRELDNYKKTDPAEFMFDRAAQKQLAKEQADVFKYFKERYAQRLGDDSVQEIIDGVMTGDPKNELARLAMYSDLTRVQPVNMSQMPVAYLNHPNARIFYMLKTFTMKQIDLMRREVIDELRTGVATGDKRSVAKASLNLAKLAGTIGLANYSVDYIRRWMVGDELEMTDAMVNTVLRNYGLSMYTLDNIGRGNIAESVGRIVAPPVSVFENPLKEAFGVDTKGRWIDSIPLVGKTYTTGEKVIEEHF